MGKMMVSQFFVVLKKIFSAMGVYIFVIGSLHYALTKVFPAIAENMSSQNYMIQGGNFNMTSGNKASQNYKLSDVVGQTAAGMFASKGYIIQGGFLNSAASGVFSFSVSPLLVDFGLLSPNTPVERNIQISISNGNLTGYNVTVWENGPLTTTAEAKILDTTCENTAPCTKSQATKWADNTTYGFGYRMKGITVPRDFDQNDYYRPFPASQREETPVQIMQSKAKKVSDQAVMTVRVNIGPEQPVGRYKNVLSFTAIGGI